MVRTFIAVGSNLGNREQNFSEARLLLAGIPNVLIVRESPVYETDPVGGPRQGKFLNAVWEVHTDLPPREFLRILLSIEQKLGRDRKERNAPRTLDLDLLFYENAVLDEKGLCVPHPRLHERRFVLEPMADLAPDWEHPKLKCTIEQLWGNYRENH